MTIELSASVERELEDLAVAQQRNIGELFEEAIRLYLEATVEQDSSRA
jgi:predicted transcriptional regulator